MANVQKGKRNWVKKSRSNPKDLKLEVNNKQGWSFTLFSGAMSALSSVFRGAMSFFSRNPKGRSSVTLGTKFTKTIHRKPNGEETIIIEESRGFHANNSVDL